MVVSGACSDLSQGVSAGLPGRSADQSQTGAKGRCVRLADISNVAFEAPPLPLLLTRRRLFSSGVPSPPAGISHPKQTSHKR